jgi:hypothetical protein
MLVNFFHGVNIVGFLDVQSHHLNGVHLLVYMIYSSINFTEAPLTDQIDLCELLQEPPCLQNVLEWGVLANLTQGGIHALQGGVRGFTLVMLVDKLVDLVRYLDAAVVGQF